MKFFLYISVVFSVLLMAPKESSARLFTNGEDAAGNHPEYYTDDNNNGQHDWTDSNGNGRQDPGEGEEFVDTNKNGVWDADSVPDITNMTYSATWDANFPLAVCLYDRRPQLQGEPAKLVINTFFVQDTAKVLFGIDDPAACPLPGSQIFIDYPNSIAGEFLISGVICVVNTVIFDSMFKVYCTIILWFYNILYAMIIIYIMFYGLSIMLGIGNDPIREAPKRIIKIILIFFFAVNAQFGFRMLHNGFIGALNGFTNMLTDVQPYYDEHGQQAYKKSFMAGIAAGLTLNILDGPGKLLDENGNVWRPVASGTPYVAGPITDSSGGSITSSPAINGSNTTASDYVIPEKYVPFRVPAMQWTYEKDNRDVYKIYPVFLELASAASVGTGKIACILDVKWNSAKRSLEEYPRCQKNFWPTLPRVLPYGSFCIYQVSPFKKLSCTTGQELSLAPPRLKATPGNKIDTCETLDIIGSALNIPKSCRAPFQGVLGKIDGIFNATVGDDSSKSLGALAVAILLWGSGAGMLLSLLLMTGIVTLFVAFFQLIWTYVTAIMALTFLLMLSPIFVSCALFKITEKFFKGWLSALISYTMQPFLIMAFLFVLSNMTSVDRLNKMARAEINDKTYMAEMGEGQSQIKMLASSFMGPLYNKPTDFDDYYYSNKAQTSNQNQIYINATQRATYIRKKGEYIKNYWLNALAGTDISYSHLQSEANKFKSLLLPGTPTNVNVDELNKLWNEGKYDTATGEVDTGKRAIEAVAVFNSNVDQRYQHLLECYQYGCTLRTSPYNFTRGCVSGGGMCWSGLNNGLEAAYVTPISWDDGDSFQGEPEISKLKDGTTKGPEYPVCLRYCPEFKPAYDPSDANKANPDIVNLSNTKRPDGRDCPDANGDNNPDICSPSAECTGNCMYIKDSESLNFGSLSTAIITWIILNAVTAAFFSKVPKIAEALSQWSNYAPKGMPLGGASRSWNDEGMDEWTREERSGFFHGGGLFDPGIVTGRPSGLFALGGAISRVGQGPKEVVDLRTGEITKQPRMKGEAFAKKVDFRERKDFVDFYKKLKTKYGIDTYGRVKDGEFDLGSIMNFGSDLKQGANTKIRKSQIIEEIQRAVQDNMAAINQGSLSTLNDAIEKRLRDIVVNKNKQ